MSRLQGTRAGVREAAAVLGGYLAISILYTYPLVRDFRTHVAGNGDSFQFLWNFWWVKFSLFELRQSFFHTDYLFYPHGTSLAFHDLSLLNGLLSIGLQPFLGLVGIANLFTLGAHVLSGAGAYLLVRELTGCRKSAFVSGTIFSFSAFHFNHLTRLNIASMQWLPLFVLFFLRFVEKPTPKRAALAALLYVANSLTTWYYLLFGTLWGAGMWAAACVRRSRQGELRRYVKLSVLFAALAAAGVGPFLYPAILEVLGGQQYMRLDQGRDFSADIAALFYMPLHHVLTGHIFRPLYQELLTHWTERHVFLGYLPALLALAGAVRGHRPGRWVAALAFFLLLALGPHPQLRGVEYTGITLPYHYLSQIPFLNAMRAPTRCLVMITLFGAVLAGLGCQRLFSWLERRPSGGRQAAALAALFSVWILAEQTQWLFQFPMTPARAAEHPLYQALRDEPASAAVLDLPLPDMMYPQPMYYQTVHQKRMLGGYVARDAPQMWRFVRDSPLLDRLDRLPSYKRNALFGFSESGELRWRVFRSPPEESAGSRAIFPPLRARRFLLRHGIRFVIVHKAVYGPETLRRLEDLFERAGARRYHEDATLLAYEIVADAGS
jgi:hypothetical protein